METNVLCLDCGYVWSVTDDDLRSGTLECPHCSSTDVDLADDAIGVEKETY